MPAQSGQFSQDQRVSAAPAPPHNGFPQETIFLVYLARAPARKGFEIVLTTHSIVENGYLKGT